MKKVEVEYINTEHPLMCLVLEKIANGEVIEIEGPFYLTYLLARQRGFVQRVGTDGRTIVVSDRGREFLLQRKDSRSS